MRTFDLKLVQSALKQYESNILHLDIKEWLDNPANVALTNEAGDIALFERQWRHPRMVFGHYFFHSRGKQAREAAKAFLTELFSGPYGIEIVAGLTPLDNKGARWMNRQLGFNKIDEVETDVGPCEVVSMFKKDWLEGDKINE